MRRAKNIGKDEAFLNPCGLRVSEGYRKMLEAVDEGVAVKLVPRNCKEQLRYRKGLPAYKNFNKAAWSECVIPEPLKMSRHRSRFLWADSMEENQGGISSMGLVHCANSTPFSGFQDHSVQFAGHAPISEISGAPGTGSGRLL